MDNEEISEELRVAGKDFVVEFNNMIVLANPLLCSEFFPVVEPPKDKTQ